MLGFRKVADDNLYNRRRLALFGFIFAVTWCYLLLGIDFYFNMELETSKISVYLGVPAVICGLPVWQYFKAASEVRNES